MTEANTNYIEQMEKLRQAFAKLQTLTSLPVDQSAIIYEYTWRMENLRRIFALLPPSRSRTLTVPAIFGMQTNENFISDYLAYVLNPHKNGIGTAPLERLIEQVYHEHVELEPESIDVRREYVIDNGRLDLLVFQEGQPILLIENKIFSWEGPRQTQSYHEAIERHYPDHHCRFIFLTTDGIRADSHNFKNLSYAQLHGVLRSVQYDWTANVRKSVLWEDFLTHIEEYIMTNKGEFEISEQTKLYLQNYRMIKALEEKFNQDWPDLIAHIQARFNQKLDTLPVKYTTNFPSDSRYCWQQVYKPEWKIKQINIHYEFHITPASFENGKAWFSVDVEEGDKTYVKQFFQLFSQKQLSLVSFYDTYGITYKDKNRRSWIASKIFSFEPNLSELSCVVDSMFEIFKQFEFLTDPIDQLLKEMAA